MARRVNLGNHVLGNKKNLVTKSDKKGCYDEYPCINCGKILRCYGLMRSSTYPGPCLVSRGQAKEIATRERKGDIKKLEEVCGGWFGSKAEKICIKCKTHLIKCPKKDHPNSKYWLLKRDDGCDLYICPKGCLEGEALEDATKIPRKEKKMIEADREYFFCDRKGCGDPDPCEDCQKEAVLNDDPRTVREFVEDMLSEGRSPLMIRGVAQSCRWDRYLDEINEVIKEISGKFKKKYSTIP